MCIAFCGKASVFKCMMKDALTSRLPNLVARLQVSVAEHVFYSILIFCLFCSQLTVLFTHFSTRCKILF